jgi:hypothetical protein
VTVGAGVDPVTDTDAVACDVPPAPAQLNVNVALALSPPVLCVPAVVFVPVQPPDAVHVVALVDVQVSVLLEPLLTVVGTAVSVTVGAGVAPAMDTEALACADPPEPVQLSVNVVAAFNAPVVSVPETAFAPFHPPLAVQAAAWVLVQVSVLVPPAATDNGLAVSVTPGAGVPPLPGGAASLPPPQATRAAVNTRSAILISLMAAMIGNRSARRESSA